MIKLKNNSKLLISLIKIINNFNTEVDFTFAPEGIFLRVVDLSNTCLTVLKIKKEFFEEYAIEKEITYTLDVKALLIIINKISKNEFSMEIKPDGLHFDGKKDKFVLNSYVGNKDTRPIPEVKHTCKWIVNTADLFNNMEEVKEFSAVCKFSGEDKLVMDIKSNLVSGKCDIEAEKVVCDKAYCYYDMTYFEKINELVNIFDKISFNYGKETPCVIEAKKDILEFYWMLASRVEDKE